MNKESLVKESINYQEIGGPISHELAAKMVKDHHDKHSLNNSYSYIIGKDAVNMILSQPGCVAIRFFDAINEEGMKTLVYVGVDSKGKSIMEITTINEDGKLAVIRAGAGDQILVPHPIDWFN